IFQIFGHCGTHPQFGHVDEPPRGYRFVQARRPENPFTDAPKAEVSWLLRQLAWMRDPHAWLHLLLRFLRGLLWYLWWPLRPLWAVVRHSVRYGPRRCLATLWAGLRLFRALRCGGARMVPALKFLRSRHFTSQVMVPRRPRLLFFTSVPYTYN